MKHLSVPWPYPRWIAHRGAGKLAPENTMAAFRLGAAHGYAMFECDVKLSADGIPFLLHDATLDRTTNGHGPAAAQNWSDISQLDAGAWHSRAFAGEAPPTLAAVARACMANGWMLNIEIKPTPGQEAETGRVVASEAASLWRSNQANVSPGRLGRGAAPPPPLLTSFQPEALEAAQNAAPALPRGLVLDSWREGWLGVADKLGCCAVVCNHALWTADTVALARDAGLRTLSYTVNDEWAAQRLMDLGTDSVITDRVDLFRPS